MRIRSVVAFLLLLSTAIAADKKSRMVKAPPIAAVRMQQVSRVMTPTGWTESAQAQSGSVIWRLDGDIGVILTCAHGLDEKALVHLLLSPDEMAWGRIVAIDRDRDLALIHAPIPKNITPIKMYGGSPDKGEALIVGFGGDWWDSGYLERKANISGKVEAKGYTYIQLDAPTRGGDSGGPVLFNGKLIGVHVRGDGKSFGLEVPVEDVHQFLIDKAGWQRE